jgi:hypothetical protein
VELCLCCKSCAKTPKNDNTKEASIIQPTNILCKSHYNGLNVSVLIISVVSKQSFIFCRLMSFHGAPFVWFIAQFLKYLMRPSDELSVYLHQKRVVLGMENNDIHPIVG